MDTQEHMLTTLDNPFSPFTHYDEWYAYDVAQGYNTCAYLARITKSSNDLSEADEALAIEQAIDEIVKFNLLGNYIKIDSTFKPRIIQIQEVN